jgi:hypothetical protein
MASATTVRIALLLPDLLGTYGDRGNAIVLASRLRWRDHPAEIIEVTSDQPIPGSCDLYVVGGGEDVAQIEATRLLERSDFPAAVRRGAVVLAVCAGLQIMGRSSTDVSGRERAGLGLLDLTTRPLPRRAVGEIVTSPAAIGGLGQQPLSGFENHRGGTTLGGDARPLAQVVSGVGNGDGTEGVVAGHIVGTYLHGPVLARNPALADHLLTLATGWSLEPLRLDDIDELRRERLAAGRLRRDRRIRQLTAALTPRRWLTPGVPARSDDGDTEPSFSPSTASGWSGAGGGEDGVGGEAEHEAEEDAPAGDLFEAELAGHRQQFDHDVEDGAGGQAEEGHRQGVADHALPDDRADEGGGAADQTE